MDFAFQRGSQWPVHLPSVPSMLVQAGSILLQLSDCVSYCADQVGVLGFLPTLHIFQPVFGENWKVNSLTALVLFVFTSSMLLGSWPKTAVSFLSFTFQSRVLLELWWPLGALSWLCWPIPVTFCCCDKKPWPETIQGRDCFDLQFQRARWPEWQVEHERKSRMLRNHPSTVQRKWGEGYFKKTTLPTVMYFCQWGS